MFCFHHFVVHVHDGRDHAAELFGGGLWPRFQSQIFQAIAQQAVFCAAVLAGNFIEATFKRFAKLEVLRRDRQDIATLGINPIEQPIRQSDFDGQHTVFRGRFRQGQDKSSTIRTLQGAACPRGQGSAHGLAHKPKERRAGIKRIPGAFRRVRQGKVFGDKLRSPSQFRIR